MPGMWRQCQTWPNRYRFMTNPPTFSCAGQISQAACERTCNYFSSKFVWRLLMRFVLLRWYNCPFKQLEMLLNYSNTEHCSFHQGRLLFQKLLSLKSRGVKLKIASSLTNSAEVKTLAEHSEWLSHLQFIKANCHAAVASQRFIAPNMLPIKAPLPQICIL